jgi:hypothetical protein
MGDRREAPLRSHKLVYCTVVTRLDAAGEGIVLSLEVASTFHSIFNFWRRSRGEAFAPFSSRFDNGNDLQAMSYIETSIRRTRSKV